MNERIIIRRLNGTNTETEEFPMFGNEELLIGRETDCKIKFDATKDDLVSRRHAKITIDKMDPVEATLTDLGSANGTFLNRQRVFTSMKLNAGDKIQLGPGGPEFTFDYEPKSAKATRMADVPALRVPTAAPTREASITAATKAAPMPPMPPMPPPPSSGSGSTTVGKATVERMITQGKSQTRNQMLGVGFALLLLIIGVGTYFATRPKPQPTVITNNIGSNTVPSQEIAAKNTPAVVYIELTWNLIDASNSSVLYQVYFPNATKGADGKAKQIVEGGNSSLPVFISYKGSAEPLLSTDSGGGDYVPVGESGSGSGFVVSPDGFILTNRHVAAGWNTSYDPWGQRGDVVGILLSANDKGGFDESLISYRRGQFPKEWVPAQAKVIAEGKVTIGNMSVVHDSLGFPAKVQGRNDVLNVTFAGSSDRVAARVTQISNRADVAVIKVDTTRSLKKVDLNDNYDKVQAGATVTVMGYPGVSPKLIEAKSSVDTFNGTTSVVSMAQPTVTNGNIGQLLRGGTSNDSDHVIVSQMGDYYQLAINTTGAGNSGGPVFDDQGKVIGIFTASRTSGNTSVTFALPIRYGLELMK